MDFLFGGFLNVHRQVSLSGFEGYLQNSGSWWEPTRPVRGFQND
ncbi:MAG: hypothetical protein ACI8UR_002506, partial [Natronomonas sp.]